MTRLVMIAMSAMVLLAGCSDDNPPAEIATMSQEQIDAEEQHQQAVSDIELVQEALLPKAVYISREEARVEKMEREHDAELLELERSQAARSQSAPR